ncbi:SDR family oxidoreductase [Amycolatopsis pithecellobii]|uniref:NAD(P)H-binding protein n=1 Tax=Amycolatopsis pithecellobii TaxID=664692 RepID=A0A6N7Z7F6_9PSEU|nr:SDR family oxidoreductase [Amycolatopsis pithecellobii]MTD57020.1 NAD(P)H-binding protein [Amycolatopsis pithecellobii]
MSIVVTGATGHLGRLVVEALLRRGVPAADIVATGREVAGIKDIAERGVIVRRADFGDEAGLREAFAGAEKLVLVSTTTPGERLANHRRAIDAAVAAGVSLIAYTSMVRADSATTILGATHRKTEDYLRERDVPTVFLRNSWYLENYTDQLPLFLESHAIIGAAGDGRVSAASRADYAEAAAAVVTTEGHAGAVYELGGDEAFTLSELAAAVSAATGEKISYQDLAAAQLIEAYRAVGVPAEIAEALADADRGLSQGELFTAGGELRKLIGRPTTTLAAAIAAAR